ADQVKWCRDIIAGNLTQRIVEERLGLHTPSEARDQEEVIDTSNPEAAYLELGQKIAAAASREEELPPRSRRMVGVDRRAGTIERRWELLPAAIPESALQEHALRELEKHEWSRTAAAGERQLAREFVFFGGRDVERAIGLAEQAGREAAAAPALAVAANQLAQVAAEPQQISFDSALVELLNLRLARIIRTPSPTSEQAPAR
ncbi:MAG TPA: hypothetical protein VKU60_15755, partial [Chloroflexota bacterium]|nr:hypothetical protein [Chloroflexota bacterium]